MTVRIGVLLSGSGTSLENLLQRIDKGSLDAEVCVVVSTKPDAGGLERARRRGIPACGVDRKALPDEADFNGALHAVLERHAPDLLVLAGFLSRFELRSYVGRAINVHPALVPAFSGKGFYGERVYRAVLESGVKLTGATVHFCDDQYDTGPVILQEAVPVEEGDDVQSLRERVMEAERELLPRAIQLFGEGRLRIEGRRVRIAPA
jgi:phosphoribosylglycinamide formyltransferase-1